MLFRRFELKFFKFARHAVQLCQFGVEIDRNGNIYYYLGKYRICRPAIQRYFDGIGKKKFYRKKSLLGQPTKIGEFFFIENYFDIFK